MRSRYRTSGANGSRRDVSRSSIEVVPTSEGPIGCGRARFSESAWEAKARSNWRCMLKNERIVFGMMMESV